MVHAAGRHDVLLYNLHPSDFQKGLECHEEEPMSFYGLGVHSTVMALVLPRESGPVQAAQNSPGGPSWAVPQPRVLVALTSPPHLVPTPG